MLLAVLEDAEKQKEAVTRQELYLWAVFEPQQTPAGGRETTIPHPARSAT
jgi:hypothetical protein